MSKIAKTTVAGEAVYTETPTTLIDKLVSAVTIPLGALTAENATTSTFYNAADAGIASVAAFTAGFAAGDLWGDSVPFLGQRR